MRGVIAAALEQAVALAARWRIPADRLCPSTHSLRPARDELSTLRSGRGAGHQHRRRIWNRPNTSCKSGCFARAGRKNRTWWPLEPAAGAPSSAKVSPCTTSGGSARRCANEITRRGAEKHGVIIGYDRRFLSKQAAEASAEVFAGNNIPTILLSEDAPTPLITYATAIEGSAYGLVFTASHNPPEWNGLKVFRSDGSLLLDDETRQIEAETNALTPNDVIKLELDIALEAGIVKRKDYTNQYVNAVEALIDLEAIRKAGLKVIVDPMYGVGQLTLGTVLTEARCRVTFIHERHNPLVRRPLAGARAWKRCAA